MWSANVFNLNQPEILSFAKELRFFYLCKLEKETYQLCILQQIHVKNIIMEKKNNNRRTIQRTKKLRDELGFE